MLVMLEMVHISALQTSEIFNYGSAENKTGMSKVSFLNFFLFFSLSDIINLRHQSSAMCIIMLGGEDTHPWSATKVGNSIPATIPVTKKTTNKLLKPATMQSTGGIFFRLRGIRSNEIDLREGGKLRSK